MEVVIGEKSVTTSLDIRSLGNFIHINPAIFARAVPDSFAYAKRFVPVFEGWKWRFCIEIASIKVAVDCTIQLLERVGGVEDPEQLTRETIAFQPMGRLGTPLDVAYGALFFASDESAWITGASLTIDGGISARFHN